MTKPRIEGAPCNRLEAVVVLDRVDVVVQVGSMRRERPGDAEACYWRVGRYTAIVAFDIEPHQNPLTTDAVFHVINVPEMARMWELLQARGELVFITDEPLTWSAAVRVAANREARLIAPVVEARS